MKSLKFSAASIATTTILALALAGCSSLESAYQTTKDTLSGWLKSDTEKDQRK